MALKTIRGKIKSNEDALITEVKVVKDSGSERRISGYASTPNIDRVDEVVEVEAFAETLKAYRKNPIMLFMHNPYTPIGKFDEFEMTKSGLWVSGIVGTGFDPADRAWALIQQGILKAFSIGFRELAGEPKEHGRGEDKRKIYHITKLELYETSPVSIPANREALFTFDEGGKLVGISFDDEDPSFDEEQQRLAQELTKDASLDEEKSVISYHKYPVQDAGAAWDGGKARAAFRRLATGSDGEINYTTYAKGFTWVDEGSRDKLTGYKLPHHNVSDGSIVTNLRGCRAVVGVVAGARGGVNIPAEAKRSVYNHVARHIKADFGADVQEFGKLAELSSDEIIKALDVTAEEIDSTISYVEDALGAPPAEVSSASADSVQNDISRLQERISQLEADSEKQSDTVDELLKRIDKLEGAQTDLAKIFVASLARDVRKLRHQVERPDAS